jgi:AraC-like DNA-binding protein
MNKGKNIGGRVGYKNRGTFNNAFKKRYKHSPGFFKNNRLSGVALFYRLYPL